MLVSIASFLCLSLAIENARLANALSTKQHNAWNVHILHLYALSDVNNLFTRLAISFAALFVNVRASAPPMCCFDCWLAPFDLATAILFGALSK